MDAATAFQTHIVKPLASAVGEPLTAVDYWALVYDDLSADAPNQWGLPAIGLRLKSVSLEITWGWEAALRGDGYVHDYHIQASVTQGRDSALLRSETLRRVEATGADPWRAVGGEPLQAVEVQGWAGNPQAIRLSFPSGGVVVSTGYSGDPLLIGDGDELLVFSESDWRNQSPWRDAAPAWRQTTWQTLWVVTAAPHPALLAQG